MRWLHIYLSMFGLAAVFFFSATGITLNHPDWTFGQMERKRESKGQVDLHWLSRDFKASAPAPATVARASVSANSRPMPSASPAAASASIIRNT